MPPQPPARGGHSSGHGRALHRGQREPPRAPSGAAVALNGPARAPVSDEIAILRHPEAAFRRLAGAAAGGGAWIALRRPLFTALLLGCTISLTTTGTLSARLVAGGALAWSFVPLFEAASLALVGRGRPARLSFSRALDLFFAGRGAWAFALVAFGAAAAFADPLAVYSWGGTLRSKSLLAVLLLPVAAWSLWIDLCFFRIVLERGRGPAARLLFVQRALSWTASLVYFLGFASAPYLARLLGR